MIYLKGSEVAEIIRIGVGTLTNWRYQTNKTGILHGPPFVLVNGRPRYPDKELHDWVAGSPSAVHAVVIEHREGKIQ